MAQQDRPRPTSNLELMKKHLAEAEVAYGPEALPTRMLRAEIARWERDLRERRQTFAEHYFAGPASSIGRSRG
jgi:hypothetical protein